MAGLRYVLRCSVCLEGAPQGYMARTPRKRWCPISGERDDLSCITGAVMTQINQVYQGSQKPKLLDQVRYAMRTKHYSLRTEEAYIQ
jgi:hypothetical protein